MADKKERLRKRFNIVGLAIGGMVGVPVFVVSLQALAIGIGVFDEGYPPAVIVGLIGIGLAIAAFAILWALVIGIGWIVRRSIKEPDSTTN